MVTGDVTHRGLRSELDLFRSAFAPLFDQGRMLVVPGNHDRLGDDVAESLMSGTRVQAEEHGGLFVVRFDSTGPHNRRLFDSHGQMEEDDMDAICSALDRAPSGGATPSALASPPAAPARRPPVRARDHAARLAQRGGAVPRARDGGPAAVALRSRSARPPSPARGDRGRFAAGLQRGLQHGFAGLPRLCRRPRRAGARAALARRQAPLLRRRARAVRGSRAVSSISFPST